MVLNDLIESDLFTFCPLEKIYRQSDNSYIPYLALEIKNIKRILDENCSFYGSSLSGRKKSAKNILNIHYKVPVVVKEDVILLQVNNIRNKECLFLVLNKIVDYKLENQKLKIICINKQVFLINISKYSFEKMLINSIKLNNILKWQKCENFV